MSEILAIDPDYYWGWQQIAQWFENDEDYPNSLKAAENMVRLGPKEAAAYGYRGEARLFVGDRTGTIADFQRALDIDPKYAFAGLKLVDEQFAAGELTAAARTIAYLRANVGGPYVALRVVRLATRQKDLATARQHFRELCLDDNTTHHLLKAAADAMTEAGWDAAVEQVFADVIGEKRPVRTSSSFGETKRFEGPK